MKTPEQVARSIIMDCEGEYDGESCERRIAEAIQAERAEVERLRSGGCARDQKTTQFCAEAVALQARVKELEEALKPFVTANAGPCARK